jgi:hypothetical protein
MRGNRIGPARGRADNEDDRPSRRRHDQEDDYADERRRRGRRKKGSAQVWLWVCLGGGGAVLLAGLVVLVIVLLSGNGTVANFKKLEAGISGPEVTVANYKKLKADMSEKEVVAILGKPTTEEDSGGAFGVKVRTLVWKGSNYDVQCKFANDKLANWGGTIGTTGFLQNQEVGR